MKDNQVAFVGLGAAPVSLVGAAGAAIQIGQIIDLLGQGVGQAPAGIIGNRASGFYGVDPGAGRTKPDIEIDIGAAAQTGSAATAEFALQYAPDTGAAGGYNPGAWEDGATTGYKGVGELTAGQQLRMDLPPTPPGTATPRFVRLIARLAAGTDFTAGTVAFAGLVMGRTDQAQRQAPSNYTVA